MFWLKEFRLVAGYTLLATPSHVGLMEGSYGEAMSGAREPMHVDMGHLPDQCARALREPTHILGHTSR